MEKLKTIIATLIFIGMGLFFFFSLHEQQKKVDQDRVDKEEAFFDQCKRDGYTTTQCNVWSNKRP